LLSLFEPGRIGEELESSLNLSCKIDIQYSGMGIKNPLQNNRKGP